MIRNILIGFLTIFCFLFLHSCWDTESDLRDFSFLVTDSSDKGVTSAIYQIEGKQVLTGFGLPQQSLGYGVTENFISFSDDFVSLSSYGDSAIIVIGDRYLIHKYDQINKVFTPKEKNIFKISSYTQETPTIYSMELTQEDYDSATPCTVEICEE